MLSRLVIIALVSIAAGACSVPTLESESCTEARSDLKKLYSIHFDKGFERGEDYKQRRAEYITDRLKGEIDGDSGFDYLTQTGDPPKAFRIGKCSETGKDTVSFGILLFWKDAQRDEQREIQTEMNRTGDGWAVDKVKTAE